MSNDTLSQALDGLPIVSGTRVLWIGAQGRAARLKNRGAQVTAWADPDRLDFPDESFDVVVAADCLGHYEWDRWLMQEAQRVLVPGGRLAMEVPNLLSLVSPRDWAFFLQRVGVQADRSLRKFTKQPPRAYPFNGRKYRMDRVLPLLPPLGFTGIQCLPTQSPAPWVPRCVVTAIRSASRFGADPSRPYPAAAEHRARYEASGAQFFEMRSRWLGAHPEFRCDAPRAFDPGPFANTNVLVLAPHPDDEIIGCGGTLAHLIRAGARVSSLQATDGSEGAALRDATPEDRRSIRLREADVVSRTIGFAETEFWRADNGNFQCTDALVTRMRELLARVRPSLVFTPFVADIHPDHGTLNRILARALPSGSLSPRVLQYEVWGLVPPNTYSVVTDMSATIESLLRLYRTAMKVDDYVHFCEDRNAYHSFVLTGNPGLVEAFLETSVDDFRRIADPTA